jgi:HSP20 family protein
MTTTTMMPLGNLIDNFFSPTQYRPSRNRTTGVAPRAQVLEGDKDYLIRLDLPGVNRDDVELALAPSPLPLQATRNMAVQEGYRNLRHELAETMTYHRSFDLGREIATDKIEAGFENGVLSITLPKSEQAVPKRIEVK